MRAQPFRQARAERGAGEGAREHADERDSDLDGGEKATGIFREAHRGCGALAALIAENLEARRA